MADQFIQDGEVDFVGGQDASTIPLKIKPGQFAGGINIQVTNGIPQPRWGVKKRKITFPEGGVKNPVSGITVSYEEIFHAGRFQAIIPFALNGQDYLLVVISGVIYLINNGSFKATIVPIQGGGSLNETTPRLNWSLAGKFLVIFDFPNFPVVFDGITAKRSSSYPYGIPVSTIGAFNQSRLFIGNAGNEYTAGDPVGNLATPNAPVTFEEVLAPAAAFLAQVFQLPTAYANNTSEPITAMTFLQQTDSSTGIGPLLIATKNQIFSVQSQLPRAAWQPTGQPTLFASLFVDKAGVAGPRAIINVNSDVFFLSSDGQVRSASMSRQEQQKWARVPISREVQNWLVYTDPSLISFSSMGYFKNKIFTTANPYRVVAQDTQRRPIYDVAFGGMVSLSTDNMATLGHDGVVAWEGLWTACRPMDFCTINNQFFIISKDANSTNEIYEMDPALTYDIIDDRVREQVSVIYTREYNFQSPFQNKDLYSFVPTLEQVRGDFSLDVEFKPSHGTQFVPWGNFSHRAPWQVCDVPMDCRINGLAAHNFKNIVIGTPTSEKFCDEVSKLVYGNMRKVQLKLIFRGIFWELQDFLINAKVTPQNQLRTETCDKCEDLVALCVDCNNTDWAIPEIDLCHPSHQAL